MITQADREKSIVIWDRFGFGYPTTKSLEIIAQALSDQREELIKIARGKKVNAKSTGEESDRAYNQAIDDVITAIRKQGKP